MRSRSGPSSSTIAVSTMSPAVVPSAAGRQPRNVATASTIVKASTTSTREAKNAAVTAGAAVAKVIVFPPCSPVLVMRVENALRIIVEQVFAGLEPRCSLGGQVATVKIQLFYLLEPALQLFQLDIIFFELVVCEVPRGGLFRDIGFEIVAFVDELAIGIIPVGLETGDDLLPLNSVECGGFQDHRIAAHLRDVVLQHLEPPRMVVGLGQEAHAILQINGAHAFQPPPQPHPLRGRLRRDLISQ